MRISSTKRYTVHIWGPSRGGVRPSLLSHRSELDLGEQVLQILASLVAILFEPNFELSSHTGQLIADWQGAVRMDHPRIQEQIEQRVPQIGLPILCMDQD